MKRPHCGKSVSQPSTHQTHVTGAWIILIACSYCQSILGTVNKPKD